MDRTLPFGFLDHKVKCGNALIGAWFDQFAHYPAMAWKHREGGDKNHGNGVHFPKNARTKALKAFVKERLTPDLRLFLHGPDLLQGDLLAEAGNAHDDALAVLAEMHALPIQDARERAAKYRERFLGSTAWRSLKAAMDLWCACWFWPAEELDCAPLPRTFAAPSEETRTVAGRLAQALRFFHWELEFPDVFDQPGAGFDAMLGNPPWDIAKPVSKEFFSNIDPLYRSYGKQEAIRRQSGYFKDADVERSWLDYNARFRAQSNFMGRAAQPFGDPRSATAPNRFAIARGHENQRLHNEWRGARAQSTGYADPAHPFRHQGSADLNSYKLFLEATHALLHPGGRLGFVVPSGLYSDNGTAALRRLFPDALPMGVAVRLREPRGPVSNSSQLQVQPSDRAEGRRHGGHPHRLHAPQPGRLGTRRGTGHTLRRPPSGAIQPEEPGDSGNPIAAGLGDSGEDLRAFPCEGFPLALPG